MSKIANTIVNQYNENEKLKIDSVKRKNGDFAFVDNLKQLVVNDYFKNQDNLWEFFETASDSFVQILYEGVANMMENVSDIDLCTITDLKNIADMLDVEDLSLFSIPWSDELESLIDTYSVNKEYVLYGKHSLTDLETVFGTRSFDDPDFGVDDREIINNSYLSGLVDVSFKEVLINMLYDPTSDKGIEHIGLLELVVPSEYLGEDYEYVAGVRDGTTDRLNDIDHYNVLNDGEMLEIGSKFCRNYCVKVLFLRETLKSITQKNSMLGTQQVIEKMLTEYVIKEYSNVEELGFFVTSKSEEEILELGVSNDPFRSWTKFLKNIGDLGSLLNIEVVEYYDNTEYMNITPSSIPFKTTMVPIEELYSEPYLNPSGQIEYLPPVLRTIGYEEVETSEPAYNIGNERFWEKDISNEGSEDILALFKRLEIINEDDDIEVLLQFLDKVYDAHSPVSWDRLVSTDYVTDAALSDMQAKYSNISGSLSQSPWTNAKAVDYPTIAPTPFLWNLVEKTYRTFPRIIQYSIETARELGTKYEDIIDIDGSAGELYSPTSTSVQGMIKDSWRDFAKEYMSYESYHEAEDNIDSTGEQNKNAAIDGSFNMLALGDLLNIYNTTPTGALYGAFNTISGYYEYVT